MTDTSREAVERLLQDVTPGPWVCMDYTTEDPKHAGWYIAPFTAVGTIAKVNPHFYEDARFIAAARDLVPALLARAEAAEAERDALKAKLAEAVEEKLDAISTLDAWFDRRELAHDAVDQAVIDAASGYLRTSRVGGMPQKDSDLVLAVIQDMARLSLFADLFARAALAEIKGESHDHA